MHDSEKSGQIASLCFVAIFVFMVFAGVYAVGYKNGKNTTDIVIESPVYRLAQMPEERPVFAIYEAGGIVTMVTAFKMHDGRVLPHNIYGGMVPYDLLDDPIGWTDIPEGLMEVMR